MSDSADITYISAKGVAPPAGHYSQAVKHAGIVYVATQLPKSPNGDVLPSDPIEAQLEQALKNANDILQAAGTDLSRASLITLFLSDIELWGRANAAYAEILGEHKPARSVVPTGPLHLGYQIAVQVTAAA